ncbi:hypothetical protein TcCL_ESM08297 [Trypanosoma cruzi]|nr:hypothetical protein TcCL_ESM08297 [Trypanosoma cruzi]
MAAKYKKRDAITSTPAMVKELSAGMAHTDRTNSHSGIPHGVSEIKMHPQEDVLRGARFAVLPYRGVTAVRITKHLGFPQCRIALRHRNVYITDPNVDTHQWRCSPEGVNHRRHPAIAEVIIWRISGLALYPIGSRVSSTSVPSSTRHLFRCRASRGKKTLKKDAFTSRQKVASAITGGK